MMLEKFYNHAPIWVQNVMCSVKGWMIARKRYSKGFLRELKRMERREDDPEKMLRDFLELARHVPAYAKVFAAGKGTKLEDFPIINKAYVKEHYETFYNRAYKGETLVIHTSGTTGTSINIPQSQSFEHRQWATWWRYREELGIRFKTWYGWFGCGEMIVPISQTKPPFWRVELAGRRTRGRRLSSTRAARRARASTSHKAKALSIANGPRGGAIARNWASDSRRGTDGSVVGK